MNEYQTLSHTKWECKYPVGFMPQYRRKVLYGQLRQYLGEGFRALAQQKESRVEEGHLQADPVHMLLSIPPKYAVAQVGGYLKGEECDSYCPDVWRAAAKFCGRALLGARVLCHDGGTRRRGGPPVHPSAGSRGPRVGAGRVGQAEAIRARRAGAGFGPSEPPWVAPERITTPALSGSRPQDLRLCRRMSYFVGRCIHETRRGYGTLHCVLGRFLT